MVLTGLKAGGIDQHGPHVGGVNLGAADRGGNDHLRRRWPARADQTRTPQRLGDGQRRRAMSSSRSPRCVTGALPELVGAVTPARPGAARGGDGAYVHGVTTPTVDDLVKALGVGSGISMSEVRRICAERPATSKQSGTEHSTTASSYACS